MTIWDDVDQCYIDAEVVWSGRGPLPHQTLEDGWYHQVLRSSLERAAAFNEDLPSQAEVRSWKGVDAPDWRRRNHWGGPGRGKKGCIKAAKWCACGEGISPSVAKKGYARCLTCRVARKQAA
jgi:hypothetical protein